MIIRDTIFTQATLIICAAVTWWLANTFYPRDELFQSVGKSPMDYYSSDVLRKEFNQEGNLLRSLIAQKMIHFETGDRTELHYPVMTISRHDGTPPWIIHSENAVTNGGSEIIFLNGNVLVTKQNTNGESLKIIARDLRYSPAQNYAESDDNVLMSKSDSELSGRGVQVQLEPHLNLKILANVRRKHDPR